MTLLDVRNHSLQKFDKGRLVQSQQIL